MSHYLACRRKGTLEQHAAPPDNRGSWKRTGPIVRGRVPGGPLFEEAADPDEPRAAEADKIRAAIAAMHAERRATAERTRATTLAALARQESARAAREVWA